MRYVTLILLLSIAFCYGAASTINFTLSGHVFIPKEQELNFTVSCDGKEFESYYECYNTTNLTIFTPDINTYEVYDFTYYVMHSNISLERKTLKIEVDGEAPTTILYQEWNKLVNYTCYDRSGCAYTIFKINNTTYNVTKPFEIDCDSVCVFEAKYYSVDVYGNKEAEKTGTIKIDLQPPYIEFFTKEYYKPGWIRIDYKASDSGSGFSHFLFDGKNTTEIQFYADSDRTIDVIAFDNLGNSKKYTLEIKVDGEAPIIEITNTFCARNCEPEYKIVERALANVSEKVSCDEKRGTCILCVDAVDMAGNENEVCKEVEYVYEAPTITYTIDEEIKAHCDARLCETYVVTNEGNFSLPYQVDHSIYVEKICASNPNGIVCDEVNRWVHPHFLTGYFVLPSKAYGFAILALTISLILALLLWRFK